MEYKILVNFTDKHNGCKYKIGEIKTFDEKRANEILTKGKLIEKIVEKTRNEIQAEEKLELKKENKNQNHK